MTTQLVHLAAKARHLPYPKPVFESTRSARRRRWARAWASLTSRRWLRRSPRPQLGT